MNKKLMWSLLGFLVLTQTYQNCGGVRQYSALGTQNTENTENSVALPPEELSGLGSSGTVIAESTTPTSGGSSIIPGKSAVAVPPAFTFVIDYYLPFGALSDAMATPLNAAVGKAVRNTSCANVPDSQYQCGEIPFGSIIDRNRKLVTTMNIGKKFEGRTGSKSYKFNSTDGKDIGLKIYLGRDQRPSSQLLFYLPSQRSEAVTTSSKLGENIFFALTPRGQYIDTQACTMIPGLEIEIDDITLTGEVRKSDALPFGGDAVAKGKVIIHPGSLSFDQAFVCGTLRLLLVNGVPQLSLENVSSIQFQKSRYQGLRVEKHIKVGGVLGFFDDLFNLGISDQFKYAIQTEVAKQLNKEIKLTAAQVQNGTYLARYLDEAKLDPLIDKTNEEIQKAFSDSGYISALSDRMTQAACAASFASLGLPEQALIELSRLCASPKIKVKALYAAPNSSADCYKGYFDPRVGNSLGGTDWWKKSCKIVVRTEVIMQKELLPVIGCLTEAVKSQVPPSQVCQVALAEMAEKYAKGDFAGMLAGLSTVALSDKQIAEVKTLLQNQLGNTTLSVALLKKIFQ